MKLTHAAVAALMLVLSPTLAPLSAAAQSAAPAPASPAVQVRDLIYSSDGHRIGIVDQLRADRGSAPSAMVIYEGRYLAIPLATLSPGKSGFVTTLSRADLNNL